MIKGRFLQADAAFDDHELIIRNGTFSYCWQWTGGGFLSSSIVSEEHGLCWQAKPSDDQADWVLPGRRQAQENAVLTDLQAARDDDDGFTSPHLCVHAVITYPQASLQLRFVVWIYPEAQGFRSQLSVRSLEGYQPPLGMRSSGRTVRLPVEWKGRRRRLIGYCNDTQNRNDTHLDILKETLVDTPMQSHEHYRWPSILCAENDAGGVALVQESHKCVNQTGYDTGLFRCTDTALELEGWGLLPQDITADDWHQAWACWCIPYGNGNWALQRAVKRFDRQRYPLDPQHDLYTQANTWGSTTPGPEAKHAAREENVRREIDSQAALGIDVQQIDDGWQGNQYDTFAPDPQRYPEGWGPIVAHASSQGVALGLWAPGQTISLDELKASYAEAGFVQYKLDFLNLRNHVQIKALMQKVRDFVAWTGQRVRVNWDVTENSPRVGYFFAREYGALYLANRKDRCPEWVVYRPHTVLRDAWQIARYLPLQSFQIPVQNVDRVDAQYSDAAEHSHEYCLAIALAGIPLFFQETQHYTPQARDSIRALLDIYRHHRAALAQAVVYPIGSKPDNHSWTGFQWQMPHTTEGYLLVFRERLCPEQTSRLRLCLPPQLSLTLTDCISGQTLDRTLNQRSELDVTSSQAPGFQFLHYRGYGGGPRTPEDRF